MLYEDLNLYEKESVTDDELDYLFFDVKNSYYNNDIGDTSFYDILENMEKMFTDKFPTGYYVIDYCDMVIKVYPEINNPDDCIDALKDYLYSAYYYYQ